MNKMVIVYYISFLLALSAPKINGPTVLDVMYGQGHSFKIEAESNATGPLIYEVKSNQSGIFTMINSTSGDFQVNVTNEKIAVELVVRDSNDFVASYRPLIKVCHCANGGNCTNATFVPESGEFSNILCR